MKTINIDFPVLAWSSAEIEVDDDYDVSNLIQDIRDGEVKVIWAGGPIESATPLLTLELDEIDDVINNSEIPFELTVSE